MSSVKIYFGLRSKVTGNCTVRYLLDGDAHELPLRLDIANHSPTGFEWAYGGSGPAQLAIALIADALPVVDRSAVLRLHQRFKWAVVARFPRQGWRMDQLEVIGAISKLLVNEAL